MIKTRTEPDVRNYSKVEFFAPGLWFENSNNGEEEAYKRHLAVIENSDKKKEAWNLLANVSRLDSNPCLMEGCAVKWSVSNV